MKDKLNAVKTVLCAVFAAGCAVLGFFFWDASDRAGSLCLRRTMHCASNFCYAERRE